MHLNKLFVGLVTVLTGGLVLQAAMVSHEKPKSRYIASWRHQPEDMGQAKNLADQIVLGRVIRIKRAEDLIVEAPGEKGGEDRIPIEVVTIRLEKSFKGGRPETIEVFHTGLSVGTPASARRPPTGPAPPKPEDAVDRPSRLPIPDKVVSRNIILEGDPPYETGERYILLLKDGPEVKVDGNPVRTKAVVSPGTRYLIKQDRVRPVARRGFAAQLAGKQLRELEAMLR